MGRKSVAFDSVPVIYFFVDKDKYRKQEQYSCMFYMQNKLREQYYYEKLLLNLPIECEDECVFRNVIVNKKCH